MRQYQLNEPVIKALEARMNGTSTTTLATALAEIAAANTKYAGMLTRPQQVLTWAPPPSMLTVFPTIGFIDYETALLDDTGSSVTGQHDVGIVVYLSNPDPDQLAWGLRFYMQAIVRAALEDRALGTGSPDGAWGTGARKIVPGPGILMDEDPHSRAQRSIAWATFVLWARREELP